MKIVHVIWGQVAVALVTFGSIRLYTEWMTTDAFGAAMLGLGIIALLESILSMALNQTQVALCARLPSGQARRQVSMGLSRLFILALMPLCVVLALGFFAASAIWPALLPAVAVVGALFLYFAAEAVKSGLLALLMLDRHYARQSTWSAGEAFLTFAGISLALMAKPDAWSFLAAHVTMRIASTAIFTFSFGGRSLLSVVDPGTARGLWREAMAHGLPVSAMGPLGWMSAFLDRFIIGGILGTAATGTYVAATGLVGRPYALTTAILSNYFRPLLFTAGEDAAAQGRIMKQWLGAAAAIGLAGACLLQVVGPFILPLLFAIDYRDGAVPLMASFAVAQTLAIMTHALDNRLLASGRSARMLLLQAVMSIATLAIIPAGTAIAGPLGATLARCLAEALKFLATLAMVCGLAGTLLRSRTAQRGGTRS